MSGKATLHPKHLTLCERVLAANGIRVSDMSADEWLRLALDAEQTARDVGPHDPAFEFFIGQARRFEDAAALAELSVRAEQIT